MSQETPTRTVHKRARGALWASTGFYVLIAFEFFYMASPFAAYLYAVYGPGLDWLQSSWATSWAIHFFLPHIVAETRSVLVNRLGSVGFVLFAAGLAGFAIGVFQVYRAKLRRNDAVMGGLYRHIRHPQYLALIVASVGMLMIWPRYLVAIATVTVIFFYIALAKVEERICLGQFAGYGDYMRRTGMFLPAFLTPGFPLPDGTRTTTRIAVWAFIYAAILGSALLAASMLRTYALDSLYRTEFDNNVYVSVVEISDGDLEAVARLASSAAGAQQALAGRQHLLNYVVPTGMYVSEIPMHLPPGASFSHEVPEGRDPALYKVVFTEPIFDGDGLPPDGDVLSHAVNKMPLIEVHVDLAANEATATFPPPEDPFYNNRQVPVF